MLQDDDFTARMRSDLVEIGRMHMPFGKYGPANYPPRGVPIYDLPVEYLNWFVKNGNWPRGRLGELLKIVHQMKVDGSDLAFDVLREHAGGKTVLRTPSRRPPQRFD